MTVYPRRYQKDLTHNTGLRISRQLREECERAASFQGMTFSQFCRNSLRRNLAVSQKIEEEVVRRSFLVAAGKER
jgi:hypothetical protein